MAPVLKATSFGIAAAIAGAVLYYAILKSTGYHIGLVAVLVGFMVGGAVKKGTAVVAGCSINCLPSFLTYSSIVAFHVPFLFRQPTNQRPGRNSQRREARKPRKGMPTNETR